MTVLRASCLLLATTLISACSDAPPSPGTEPECCSGTSRKPGSRGLARAARNRIRRRRRGDQPVHGFRADHGPRRGTAFRRRRLRREGCGDCAHHDHRAARAKRRCGSDSRGSKGPPLRGATCLRPHQGHLREEARGQGAVGQGRRGPGCGTSARRRRPGRSRGSARKPRVHGDPRTVRRDRRCAPCAARRNRGPRQAADDRPCRWSTCGRSSRFRSSISAPCASTARRA